MPTPGVITLLLTDGRLPAGGHVHSGGIEQAIDDGQVTDLDGLERLLTARLATLGRLEATLAAASALETSGLTRHGFTTLIRETDARVPVPALRAVTRSRGRHLLRLADRIFPDLTLPPEVRAEAAGIALPLATGAILAAVGELPQQAALSIVYAGSAEASQAAVRLLGLDPAGATAILVRLAPAMSLLAEEALELALGPPATWPADGAPILDLAAEMHAARTDRYFES